MCDEKTFADADTRTGRSGELTRREFGVLSVGLGLSMVWPAAGNAAGIDVTEQDVEVETPDGTADCYFVHPSEGTHPGVLLWPDAFGLRPAMRAMGRRLAKSGYAVLVVNPYYRTKKAPFLPEGADFNDPETRQTILTELAKLDAEVQETDARAFVDHLDTRPMVDRSRKMGTIGYCMGGPYTLRTAAVRSDRIGAGASFHGARLVTDADDSPHRLIPRIEARFLIAIAENDDEREPEAKDVLRAAFDRSDASAEIEVYEGALHGWCPPDSRVYHEAQAERAWSRLLALFEEALAATKRA